MRKFIKKDKGISLVSVVITIIVLLILAFTVFNNFHAENTITNAELAKISSDLAGIKEIIDNDRIRIESSQISHGNYTGNFEVTQIQYLKPITITGYQEIYLIDVKKAGWDTKLGQNEIDTNQEYNELLDLKDTFIYDGTTKTIYYVNDKIYSMGGEIAEEEVQPLPSKLESPSISVVSKNSQNKTQIQLEITIKENEAGLDQNNEYKYYISTDSKTLEDGKWTNYKSGDTITINPGEDKEYYIFVKKIKDNNNQESTGGVSVIIGEETYHRYGPYSIKTEPVVIYDYATNGGTGTSKERENLVPNSLIDLTPTATKEGWTFVGWNTNKNATTKLTSITMGTSDVTLYAIYSKKITVAFHYYNNKTIEIVGTIYNNNTTTTIEVPENPAVPDETRFRFWSSSNKANATSGVNPKDEIKIKDGENTNYYASYEYKFNLSYNLNGGTSESIGTQEVTGYANYKGEKQGIAKISEIVPIKDNYTFIGWNTKADGTGTRYNSSEEATLIEDTVLYAQWKQSGYIIVYNLDGGTVTGNPTQYDENTETITLNNPSKEGYTFTGWTGSNGNTPQTNVTIEKGSTGDREYTANWNINSYTLTYDANGGTVNQTNTTANYNSDITLPTPTRSYTITYNTNGGNACSAVTVSYTFNGWYTSKTNGTKREYTKMPAYNETLYAGWTSNSTTLATTTRDGYTFEGWYTDSELNNKVTLTDGKYTPTADVTLYAKWVSFSVSPTDIVLNTSDSKTQQLTANGQNYGTVTYSSSNTSIATVSSTGLITAVANGSCQITAKESKLGLTVTLNVTVNTKIDSCDIALDKTSYIYDGTTKNPTVIVKDGETSLTKDTHYEVSYSNNINAGTATVTITGKGNYTGTATKTFTIEKATLTVTANSKTKTYGEKDPALDYECAGQVNNETPKFSGALIRDEGESAGKYTIKQGTLTVIDNSPFLASNYKISFITADFTITNATISGSVKITGTNKYNETLTADVTVNPENATLSYQWYSNTENSTSGGTAITGATSSTYTIGSGLVGKYIYVVVIAQKDNYADATFKDITDSTNNTSATVTKVSANKPTITGTYTYNGKAQTVSLNGYDENAMNVSNNTRTDAGSQTVKVSLKDTANYQWNDGTITEVSLTFTIDKKSLAVTWGTTTSFVYNGSAQAPTVTTPIDGVNGEKVNLTVSGAQTNVGDNYTAKATISSVTNGQAKADNYELTGNTKTFSITKATLSGSVTITGTNTYGETLTADVTVNPEDATLSYQWYSNTTNSTSGGTAITGATSSTYKIEDKELQGKYIYVVVTVSKTNYEDNTFKDITDSTNNETATVQLKLTVTFYKNTSSADTTTTSATYTYGTSGQTFSNYASWTRTGYTLVGWTKTKTNTTKDYTVTNGINDSWIKSNAPSIELYAVWQKSSVDLLDISGPNYSFNSNDGTVTSPGNVITLYMPGAGYTITVTGSSGVTISTSSTQDGTYTEVLNVPSGSATGQTYTTTEATYIKFSGVGKIQITLQDGSNAAINDNLPTYTITFMRNYTSTDTTVVSTATYKKYATKSVPTYPTGKTGYHVIGWNTDRSASSASGATSNPYVTADATYYAIWSVNTATVKYYANGASGNSNNNVTIDSNGLCTSHSSTVKYTDTAANLYNCTTLFTRSGYYIEDDATAWRKDSATSTTYVNQASYDFSTLLADQTGITINLYANWKQKTTPTLTLSETSGSVNYNSEKTFTATASVAGTIEVTSGNTTYVTISSGNGNSLTANAASTIKYKGVKATTSAVTITVKFTPTDTTRYNTKTETYSATVAKATGYVTLDADKSVRYGTSSTTFAVKTNHGGTLTVSDNNSTAGCSISGTTVTISNIGSISVGTTVQVTVTCAATTNYTAATATFSLTFTKATPTLTLTETSGSVAYNSIKGFGVTSDVAGTIAVTSTNTTYVTINSGNGSSLTANNATGVSYKGVKITTSPITITIVLTPSDTTNYAGTGVTYSATVIKATPTVTVKITGTNSTEQTLTATATTVSNGTKSYQWWYSTSSTATSGTNITGATSSTYKITEDKYNKYIGCTVTVASTTNYNDCSGSDITDATNNSTANVQDETPPKMTASTWTWTYTRNIGEQLGSWSVPKPTGISDGGSGLKTFQYVAVKYPSSSSTASSSGQTVWTYSYDTSSWSQQVSTTIDPSLYYHIYVTITDQDGNQLKKYVGGSSSTTSRVRSPNSHYTSDTSLSKKHTYTWTMNFSNTTSTYGTCSCGESTAP